MSLRTRLGLPRLGLRPKIMIFSNVAISATMGLITVLGAANERRHQYEALEQRARSLGAALAVPVTDALMNKDLGLTADTGLTDTYISEILASNRDSMLYVIVTDAAGVVTHTNLWSMVGEPFERALDRSSIVHQPDAEIRSADDGERILEVREPLHVSTKFWGSLAVGFSLEPVEQRIEVIVSRLVVIALLVIAANSIISAISMEWLIRPILALHQVMQRAGGGDLSARAAVRRHDEIGELARAFNGMMDELEESREREKVRRSQLAHTEKMAAVGTLAAGVAHEVNNPVAGVLTCIENMQADPENREMRERYLSLIHDGVKRIELTVASLLDFSRPRSMRIGPTSLNQSLTQVLDLVRFQLRKGGVESRLDLDPRNPWIAGDRFQIEQLFLNLMLNALQAMPDGGTLTLRTRRHGAWELVEIGDTGTGIPEAIRERIFDPFFTTREVGHGTGLGLAVSYNIAAAHGGGIEVETTEGEGSVFRVLLPADDEEDEEA
ncbi:MAG: HAMP domain-containing protein [Acidobacteria bacterium]|nr:HAMP domain-containing protein [Acidobacteriota bacterium]